MSHPPFHGHPAQPPYGSLAPPHAVYAPLYDSRRVWRPQLYHREDARSNSLPPEVLHSTVYQPPLRERFNSLDSNYCSAAEHRGVTRDYGRVPLGYEDLFRRKQELWAHHHHHHHHSARPSQTSPIFTIDLGTKRAEGSGSPCLDCRLRGEDSLAPFSPWSCGSIGLGAFEPDSHTPAHSCSQHMEMNDDSGCSGNGVAKPWLHPLENYRRLKEEDPIIPFSEGPMISKFGAISRAARTGFHTTDPVQATAYHGSASTTAINFRDYNSHLDQTDYRWSNRGSNSSGHSGFLEREQLSSNSLKGQQHSLSPGENIAQSTPQSEYVLDEERLSESESEPDRDIELELCALDMEDTDQQEVQSQDSGLSELASLQTEDTSRLLSASCPSPLLPSPAEEYSQTDSSSSDKIDILRKKMAFR